VKGLKSDDPPTRVTTAIGGTRENPAYLPRKEGSITWSPDSTRVAFLSDGVKPGQLQLCIKDLRDGSIKRLTNVKGFLDAPRWSPDGKTIAVLFIENAPRASGPLVAEVPETGEIKDSFFEQRLALVDVATGKLRQITPPDIYIYEYDWAPDSHQIVATAARGNGDNNWYIAQLFVFSYDAHALETDGGIGSTRPLYKPQFQIARPVWSPDGKTIAFIEGLMSDEPSVGGDVFVIPASGGTPKNLTPNKKFSASWLAWTKAQELFSPNSSVAIPVLPPSILPLVKFK